MNATGGSWLIPVSMKAIITQPKEQVYETYSLLLDTPKESYLFHALGNAALPLLSGGLDL